MMEGMKLSKFTLFFGLYTVASSVFMLEVWKAWKAAFGMDIIMISFVLASGLAGLGIIYKNILKGRDAGRIILVCGLFAWGFIFALRQPYASEKAHVLEFGVLGWLAVRDLSRQDNRLLKKIFAALAFLALIGSLAEGIQRFIPGRVFEIRDMITNITGAAFGLALYLASELKRKTGLT